MKATTNVSKAKSRCGFTLVEMLVVIGMIAALAGISFPVYRSIQNKVEKQRVDMDIGALDRAVNNFELEYNYLPYVGGSYPSADGKYQNEDVTNFTSVLAGFTAGGNNANFKKIEFFEASEAKGGPGNYYSGIVTTGSSCTYYTPAGNELETIKLDHNSDGQMAFGFGVGIISTPLKWQYQHRGVDGVWQTEDDIINWEIP